MEDTEHADTERVLGAGVEAHKTWPKAGSPPEGLISSFSEFESDSSSMGLIVKILVWVEIFLGACGGVLFNGVVRTTVDSEEESELKAGLACPFLEFASNPLPVQNK